jgi:hypothetical protein
MVVGESVAPKWVQSVAVLVLVRRPVLVVVVLRRAAPEVVMTAQTFWPEQGSEFRNLGRRRPLEARRFRNPSRT